MPTVLLVRHGRTTANSSGVLAGWTAGVALDEHGGEQMDRLAQRLAALPLAAVVASPLQRCQESADRLVAVAGPQGQTRPAIATDDRIAECRYGDWTGREIKSLVKDPLWQVVQRHPSAAVFPGEQGESMRAMQQRALDCMRDWDARIAAEHGDDSLWVAVSHGDVIKAILADAVGAHLDEFQRIVVAPSSVSAIRYTPTRPFLLRCNDGGADFADLVPARGRKRASRRRPKSTTTGDAVVGGGA